jgi:DNA-binding NtrC family response regulator
VVSLAQGFLDQVNAREGTAKQFSPGALERLKRLAWRGNVRELKNSVERAAILADAVIRSRDLPALEGVEAARGSEEVVLDIQVGSRLDDVEQRVITATLAALGGNKKEAARVLGISLKTLYSRIHASPADAQPARATNRVVDASRLTAGGAVAAE